MIAPDARVAGEAAESMLGYALMLLDAAGNHGQVQRLASCFVDGVRPRQELTWLRRIRRHHPDQRWVRVLHELSVERVEDGEGHMVHLAGNMAPVKRPAGAALD